MIINQRGATMKEIDTEVEAKSEPMVAGEVLAMLQSQDLESLAFFFDNAVKPVGIGQWMRAYEGDPSYELLKEEIFSISARIESLPGKGLLAELHRALDASVAPIEYQDADDLYLEESPHFPSGIPAIDETLKGRGFYGVTVIAGAPKVGKSLMAIGSAVESARAGWKVIYVNAEMSRAHFGERLRNFMGKIDPLVVSNLRIANVTTGITQRVLLDSLSEADRIEYQDEKILIVVDSINRVVDMGSTVDSEAGYWRLLRDWSAWAMNSRRETEGKISWLIVSELAQHGGVKGRNLEYLADTIIRVNGTGTEEIVEVDIPFSRATRAGYIGAMRRDFATGRFLRGN